MNIHNIVIVRSCLPVRRFLKGIWGIIGEKLRNESFSLDRNVELRVSFSVLCDNVGVSGELQRAADKEKVLRRIDKVCYLV